MPKAPPKRRTDPAPAPATASRWLDVLDRRARWIALAAILLATVRIVSTYTVFNHTFDEPAHIGTGMEWIDKGTYTWEAQHPPLARIAAALGPYLLGGRTHKLPPPQLVDPKDNLEHEGIAILYDGHHYDRTLAAARAGILPFFWLACFVVYVWARRYFDARIAALAVVVFTFIPPVLAHAGLATTDMALAACSAAAFLSGLLWIERPSPRSAVIFGLATAAAVVSKFSSLAFLPAAAAAALIVWFVVERPDRGRIVASARRLLPTAALAVAVACVAIWAVYRFSFSGGVPAPELFKGIAVANWHNRVLGHEAYFMGRRSSNGWWMFFPTLLAVKTPLALLLLLGLWAGLRRRAGMVRVWLPLAFAGAVLFVGMAGRINIGLRHILPVYIGLSIVAAVAVVDLLEMRSARKWLSPALGVLALWFAGSSLWSHPDYLPYFNELAGSEPERIVVDSDLDWGQDAKRLSRRLREVGATSATFITLLTADFEKEHGFPPLKPNMDVLRPSPGWNAIGLTYWKARRLGLRDQYPDLVLWPDRIPPHEKVGKSIYLWHFPEAAR